MRFYGGWFIFLSMAIYAWSSWKAWKIALCFMIATMAIIERPDFPKSGIPGLSAWNVVYLNVIFAYIVKFSKQQKLHPLEKMPVNIKLYLWYYLFFIVLAFLRAVLDDDGLVEIARYIEYMTGFTVDKPKGKDLFINFMFNTIKYAVPGVLCYWAADNRKSIIWIVFSILSLNLILALLVIKAMPIAALTDGGLLDRTGIRVIDRDIGYYRSDLAVLFAGAAWSFFILKSFFNSWILKGGCYFASFSVVMAMSLTGGRIGQGAWVVLGMFIAYYRFKILLFIGPLMVILILTFVPSVQERFTQGLVVDEAAGEEIDTSSATSGRGDIWPYVIDKILETPFFGNGRKAMQRIGLSTWLGENVGKPFPHPHNAYMQLFLDGGFILGMPILIFYIIVLRRGLKLFRDNRNILYMIVGGLTCSFVIGHLVGSLGSQSFYPYPSSVSMLCTMGLALRVYQKREIIIKNNGDHSLLFEEEQELSKKKKVLKGRSHVS